MSKECQGDERLEVEHHSWKPAALVLILQGGASTGLEHLILAGFGLQRVGSSECPECGCRAGSGVAASLCLRTRTRPWVRTFIPREHPGPQRMLSDNGPRTSSPLHPRAPSGPLGSPHPATPLLFFHTVPSLPWKDLSPLRPAAQHPRLPPAAGGCGAPRRWLTRTLFFF